MLETLLEAVVPHLLQVVVIVAVIVLTVALRQAAKVLSEWLGLDIAEWEVWHVAERLIDTKEEHSEAYQHTLEIVSDRLAKRGIKVEEAELGDIIKNALKELKQQESTTHD